MKRLSYFNGLLVTIVGLIMVAQTIPAHPIERLDLASPSSMDLQDHLVRLRRNARDIDDNLVSTTVMSLIYS